MEKGINEITLNGRRYISVKRAADLGGYTNDYVGQLCRSSKVEATRVGRNWYVDENSFIEHKQSQTGSNTVSEADKTRIVRKSRQTIFNGPFIIYSRDDRPLLPLISKKTKQVAHIPIQNGDEKTVIVPESIFTKAGTTITSSAKRTLNLLTVSRSLLISSIALALFVALFSINGPYTRGLLTTGAKNMSGVVLNSEFGATVNNEIIEPFELVAKEINSIIDDTVYSLLYENILRTP